MEHPVRLGETAARRSFFVRRGSRIDILGVCRRANATGPPGTGSVMSPLGPWLTSAQSAAMSASER